MEGCKLQVASISGHFWRSKKSPHRWLYVLLIAVCCLLFTSAASAQEIIVDATVDSDQVTTDQQVVLTVAMNAPPDSPPELAALTGFRVTARNNDVPQIRDVNGVQVGFVTYKYTLQPVEAGTFRIDPIRVFINGQVFSTNPVTITVTEGNVPPPEDSTIATPTGLEGQDFYAEAIVNKEAPYLGEQVLYLFNFYQAAELASLPSYELPSFTGFWNPQVNEQVRRSLNTLSERTYRINTLVSPLFPTLSGTRQIDVGILNLGDGRMLETAPVTVEVTPLPQPEPEGFSGAVGAFTISAEVDKTNVAINETITWRIRVEGIGNIDTLPEPRWPELEGWRNFEEQVSFNTSFVNGVVNGQRNYERVLIPSAEGTTTLPALDYIFFNPETEQYEQSSTQPIELVVQGGEDTAGIANAAGDSLLPDIRPIRTTPNRLTRQPFRLLTNPLYWLLWLIPAVAVVADKFLRVQRQRSDEEIEAEQRQNAWRLASQAIKAARKDKSTRADQAAERILTSYLSDKFSEPFVGLSQSARTQQLRQHHVRESLIRWTNRIYDLVEGARYGYASGQTNLLDEVEQLMSRFERGEGV